ncbi:MAG TPA: peptidase M61 [Burkholderiaceae bacterium]
MEFSKEFHPSRFALRRLPLLLALASALASPLAHAAATSDNIALKDTPYPGKLSVDVDMREAARKIFTVHEVIPVTAGALTLRYPKWIPGEHSPSGTLDGVTALHVSANGKALTWRRQLVDMFALDLQVPAGVTQLTVDFSFLSPIGGGAFGQSTSATPHLAELEWNQVLFYPAGYPVRQIPIDASVRVPDGWQFATALEHATDHAGGAHFKTVSVEQLVDSPLFTGQYFRRIELTSGTDVPVRLNLIADRPGNLALKPEQIEHHKALVKQAVAMFGAQHYDHYDFLLALSDNTGSFGLEHHQSSDDRIDAEFFTEPELYLQGAGLLPHEYVHSWNGKFRRPAGLATQDYTQPMKGDLLWVYEGLTEYLGNVLTARSGLWTADQYRDNLAMVAAAMDHVPGRDWRALQDTADAAQLLYFAPHAWVNSRRAVDYYPEGELIWLDVDTRIRELSNNARSLDDFLHAFHGIKDGNMDVRSYSFDDVVNTLQTVQPNDWRGFLRQRLDTHEVRAPLDGVKRGGWKLVYTDVPSANFKAAEKQQKDTNRISSIGLMIESAEDTRGTIGDVLWGSAAFDAGLIPGMKVIAINGEHYAPELLDAAIAEAAKSHKPIDLLVKNTSVYTTVHVAYYDGPKFPHLLRADGEQNRLEAIIKAKG